jgi:hypothetical protein
MLRFQPGTQSEDQHHRGVIPIQRCTAFESAWRRDFALQRYDIPGRHDAGVCSCLSRRTLMQLLLDNCNHGLHVAVGLITSIVGDV